MQYVSYQGYGSIQYEVLAPVKFSSAVESVIPEPRVYSKPATYSDYVAVKNPPELVLLEPIRPVTKFINSAWEIKDYVEEAFWTVTGKDLPANISIIIEKPEEFTPGTLGLAIHSKEPVIKIARNDLDKMMLVLGHELGHVLAPRSTDPVVEEAKAFAFEMAWAKAIREKDIAGLSCCIASDIRPAANGLHDKAFQIVLDHTKKGHEPYQVFLYLSGVKTELFTIDDVLF